MHYLIATISLFDKMFCLDISRRSTRQRGLPGTTLITQTMWAVSTSSARSPLVCSTCWMRRASTNRWFTRFHSCLMADFFFFFDLVEAAHWSYLFFLFVLLSSFSHSVPLLQLSPRHRWNIISQIQAAAPREQILCPHSSHGACLCYSTLCWKSQISSQGKVDEQRRH